MRCGEDFLSVRRTGVRPATCTSCRGNSAKYRTTTPEKRLLHGVKARAKMKGLDFDLDIEDLAVPTHCPVLGIPLSREFTKRSENTPSVDRRDPSRGYTKDNVVVVSWRANRIKNNATTAELQRLAHFYANT